MPSATTPSASSPGVDPCEDLVPARGMLARETDVAKRAPGRGPLPGQVRGVDASTRAPWKALRDQDFAFAFVQAALGNKGNVAFRDNWEAAKRCGFPRGAYHFVTAQTDGVTQARTFLAARGPDAGEIPSTIDLEKPPRCTDTCCNRTCKDWESTIRGWVDTVKAADGRDPMIYAVEPFWNQCVCASQAFKAHPLWMPAWPKFDFPDPVKYGGWKRWDFYQYDGNVRVGDGVIDINLFRGSKAELVSFLEEHRPRG